MDKSRKLNPNFQVLKGICALVVFFSHSLNIFPLKWVESISLSPLHLFLDGQCAVMVFFLLSGYFYYNEREPGVKNYLAGLKRKIRRIYPVHIIGIIVCFLLILFFQNRDNTTAYSLMTDWASKFWRPAVSVKELICNALIVLPHNPDLINPPTWYLFTEVRMFIVMPLLVWFAKRTHFSLFYLLLIPSFFWQLPFLQYLFTFVLGTSLHKNINRINISSNWVFAALFLAGLVLLDINNIFIYDSLPVVLENIILSLQSVGAAMLVFVLAKIPVMARNSALMVRMGNISYEFYITHFLVVMSISLLLPSSYVMIPLSLAVSITIAVILRKVL